MARHDFTTAASQANQVWVSDVTEHRTREGKLYFCAVKDIFSNRIIGYAAGSYMSSSLALSALNLSFTTLVPQCCEEFGDVVGDCGFGFEGLVADADGDVA